MRSIGTSIALAITTGLALSVLPGAPALAARPSPPAASITVTQDTDTETGTPIVLATYLWSGFKGRVTSTVTIFMNGEPVTTVSSTPGAASSGDLAVYVPAKSSESYNTFSATGSLQTVHRGTTVPGSTKVATPVDFLLEAVPCPPGP